MNKLILIFVNTILSRMILKLIESDNFEYYDIKVYFNKKSVLSFDFYKILESKKMPEYINLKDKKVEQINDQSLLSCSIDKKYMDYISRYIIVIFFKDYSCCVTPSFYLYDSLNEITGFDVFYQGNYINPLELINGVILFN